MNIFFSSSSLRKVYLIKKDNKQLKDTIKQIMAQKHYKLNTHSFFIEVILIIPGVPGEWLTLLFAVFTIENVYYKIKLTVRPGNK